jgi:hypothetical protein
MADDVVAGRSILEFVVTVVAIIIGLVLGKFASQMIAKAGIPIAAGNPIPVTIPGGTPAAWRK